MLSSGRQAGLGYGGTSFKPSPSTLCHFRESGNPEPQDVRPSLDARLPGRVKTIWGFYTASFRSLFRGLRPRRTEKIAKIFALRDRLQNFSEFSHGLFRGYDKLGFAQSIC
jgi:hypothetical protein